MITPLDDSGAPHKRAGTESVVHTYKDNYIYMYSYVVLIQNVYSACNTEKYW